VAVEAVTVFRVDATDKVSLLESYFEPVPILAATLLEDVESRPTISA
jgi:hypothetical protein